MVCLASRLIPIVICELRLHYVWPLAIESALCLSNEGYLFESGEGKSGHKENTLNSLLKILCLLYRIGNLLYKSSLFQYKMSLRSQGKLAYDWNVRPNDELRSARTTAARMFLYQLRALGSFLMSSRRFCLSPDSSRWVWMEIIGAESLPIPVSKKEDLTFRQNVTRKGRKAILLTFGCKPIDQPPLHEQRHVRFHAYSRIP